MFDFSRDLHYLTHQTLDITYIKCYCIGEFIKKGVFMGAKKFNLIILHFINIFGLKKAMNFCALKQGN